MRQVTKGCSWSYSEALLPAFDWIAFLREHQGGNVGFMVVRDPEKRVIRGGSKDEGTAFLPSACYSGFNPALRFSQGFRVVCDE